MLPYFRQSARCAIAATLAVSVAGCGDSTNPTLPTQPTTISFSNALYPGGSAWRSVKVDDNAKVTVQFVSILPQTEIATRVSFGTFDGTNCNLTQSVDSVTSATDPQITVDVNPGNYCVRIADIGQVTQIATFSVTIVITPS
jgi:hypothetical protein